jgi:CBS domain-containing protein
MQVKEIMKKTTDLVICSPSDYVMDAAKKMENKNVGCILITENNNLKGILTDRDITLSVVAHGKNPREVMVKEIMKTDIITGRPEWDLFEATKLMADKKIRRLPIQSNERLEGFVSLADLAPVIKGELDSFLEIEAAPIGH